MVAQNRFHCMLSQKRKERNNEVFKGFRSYHATDTLSVVCVRFQERTERGRNEWYFTTQLPIYMYSTVLQLINFNGWGLEREYM